jgi:hypothetical protein
MKSLENLILLNEIKTQPDFEKQYSENAKELSTLIDQNITIFSVIEDYKKALILLKTRNINIENKFNRDIFTLILAKIKAIGITNWKTEIPEFTLYRNYLIQVQISGIK